jgi:hypothetical protein
MTLMEKGGGPKSIIEVLLDHVTSASGRKQNYAALLEVEKEFPLGSSAVTADVSLSKSDTIAFEGKSCITIFLHISNTFQLSPLHVINVYVII